MKLSEQKAVCKASILFLKMCRRQAYAHGQIEYGFQTHFLEQLANRILDHIDMHEAVNSMFWLEEE